MSGWWAWTRNVTNRALGQGASHNRSNLQHNMGPNKDPYYGTIGQAAMDGTRKERRTWMRQQLGQKSSSAASSDLLGGG